MRSFRGTQRPSSGGIGGEIILRMPPPRSTDTGADTGDGDSDGGGEGGAISGVWYYQFTGGSARYTIFYLNGAPGDQGDTGIVWSYEWDGTEFPAPIDLLPDADLLMIATTDSETLGTLSVTATVGTATFTAEVEFT